MRGLLLIAACLAAPVQAFATAGFAERHSELKYNDWATVHWIHPGDGCDVGKYCLSFRKTGGGWFTGLEGSFERVSLPVRGEPRVLAERQRDHQWILYDLREGKLLLETGSIDAAMAAWTAGGKRAPRLADAQRASGLRQMWSSWGGNLLFAAILFLPFMVIGAGPFLVFLAVRLFRKSATPWRSLDYVLFALLGSPALLVGLLFLRGCAG
ncbi:MAG: hypothetical protein HY078_05020 [Elusimicrobia bacterium]|nr:hypothetical protein [Elusimicrobiota bacterium]